MTKTILFYIFTLVFLFTGCSKLATNIYYKTQYKPEKIIKIDTSSFPTSFMVSNTPCISYKTAYCSSASYQMVGFQKGLKKEIGYFNWVMGFTYGAYFDKKHNSFIPYNDPETGFYAAKKYTGIQRHYLATNDSLQFIAAVKYYILKNEPLRIALNPNILLHKKGFSPHSELIVGFNKDSVFYYETGITDRNISGHKGESCSWNDFTASVKSFCERMNLPWKYNLSYFEKTKTDTLNQIKCAKRNGELMVGRKNGPYMRSGSFALNAWGEFIAKSTKELNWNYISSWVDVASTIRKDNADYLKLEFKNIAGITKVCELLNKSGDVFAKIVELISKKDHNKKMIGDCLIQCSILEKEAGQWLTIIAKENGNQ